MDFAIRLMTTYRFLVLELFSTFTDEVSVFFFTFFTHNLLPLV